MPHYIVLGSFTEQGIRDIKGLPARIDAQRQRLEAAGGRLQFFLTMGQHDWVAVTEAPSDEVATRFLLALGSLGNSRTTTLKAYTEEETRRIIAGLP